MQHIAKFLNAQPTALAGIIGYNIVHKDNWAIGIAVICNNRDIRERGLSDVARNFVESSAGAENGPGLVLVYGAAGRGGHAASAAIRKLCGLCSQQPGSRSDHLFG